MYAADAVATTWHVCVLLYASSVQRLIHTTVAVIAPATVYDFLPKVLDVILWSKSLVVPVSIYIDDDVMMMMMLAQERFCLQLMHDM